METQGSSSEKKKFTQRGMKGHTLNHFLFKLGSDFYTAKAVKIESHKKYMCDKN